VLAFKEVAPNMASKIQVIDELATRMAGKLAPSEQSDPAN
jgi:hypothetical protein